MKVTVEELERNLAQFIGSEHLYKFSIFTKIAMTEGVKYLAETAGCFWILDIFASVQHLPQIRNQEFQTLRVKKLGERATVVTVEDGNSHVLYSQKMSSDFPLQEFKMFCQNGVLYLPQED